MAANNVTLAQARTQIVRALGELVAEGTVAIPTTTTIHAAALTGQKSDQYKGAWLYLNGGGGSGQERAIYASTPYSPGSPTLAGRIDVLQPLTTVPSTNTTFEVYRTLKPSLATEAIKRAVRQAALKYLTPLYDYGIVLNSRLDNGTFDRWATSTSAPDGWTSPAGTVTQEANNVYPGSKFAASIANATGGETTVLRQDVPDYSRFAGKQATLKALIATNSANSCRVSIQDGVNTTNSAYHTGKGDETLSVTATVADNPARLRCNIGAIDGASGIVVKKAWLEVGGSRWEYPLPTDMAWLYRIYVEDLQGEYAAELPQAWYSVDASGATPLLLLRPEAFEPIGGKVLRVEGQAYATEPSAESDSLEVSPEAVIYRASEELLRYMPWGEQDIAGWRRKHEALREAAERFERMAPRVKPGSLKVREF